MTFGGSFGRRWGHERKRKVKKKKRSLKIPPTIVRPPSSKKTQASTAGRRSKPSSLTGQQQVHDLIPVERELSLGEPAFTVVILSASAFNLRQCLQGVFKNEPDLIGNVIVVDDGAKKDLKDVPGVRWVSGKKPFVFARNANIGIKAAAPNDVILLNDDAVLQTPGGFTLLAQAVRQRPSMGLCSAGIVGHVGNPNQNLQNGDGVRREPKRLAFVCVYISRDVLEELGYLDERFIGYGYEDDDYCIRASRSYFSLGVFDGCVVEHSRVPSTFRAKNEYSDLMTYNRKIFEEKWSTRHL